MQIHRHGTATTTTAPEQTFTGEVRISGYVERESPSRLKGALVTFPPGARTSWKVNPAGDVVWCPPGRRHWDGATPYEAMTCLALHEGEVQLLDTVTDEQYDPGPAW